MAERGPGVRSPMGPLLLGLLLWASASAAHEQNTAITTVLFNPRTEHIEVMHEFSLHDAEHAARKLSLTDRETIDLHRNQRARDAFSLYVSQRFFLSDRTDRLLPLTLVGSEVDGNRLWVYQEIPIPQQLQGLIIRHHALRDIWPRQVNRVNIEREGTIRTLIFEGSTDQQSISFEQALHDRQ